jgi:hypothetical protein
MLGGGASFASLRGYLFGLAARCFANAAGSRLKIGVFELLCSPNTPIFGFFSLQHQNDTVLSFGALWKEIVPGKA